jgi:hypothetical protein
VRASRGPTVRIHEESNPDPLTAAEVERVEAELAEMDDLEDWSEAELRELLEEAAERLQLLLPGKVHGYAPSVKPTAPTKARPGSAEKIKVMRERARRGEGLFHPNDARMVPRGEVV